MGSLPCRASATHGREPRWNPASESYSLIMTQGKAHRKTVGVALRNVRRHTTGAWGFEQNPPGILLPASLVLTGMGCARRVGSVCGQYRTLIVVLTLLYRSLQC